MRIYFYAVLFFICANFSFGADPDSLLKILQTHISNDTSKVVLLNLLSKDLLYIFTDGYADQKGGPNNKKFFAEALRNLLKEIATLQLTEQKNVLQTIHTDWKGGKEQMDDILIIGVRI